MTRIVAMSMTLVIVLLSVVTFLSLSGLSRSLGGLRDDVSTLQRVAIGDDDPVDPNGSPRRFVVERGETAASIADRLQGNGLVADARAFRYQARGEGVDAKFEAGEYQLSPAMRPSEIMLTLQSGRFAGQTLTVPEGWRAAQIADAIEALRPGSRSEVIDSIASNAYDFAFLKDRPTGATLEGYLFPETYQLEKDTPVKRVIERMLGVFGQRVTGDVIARAKNQGLTLQQTVTLASIVEREAQLGDERPLIAAVFLKRMKAGMPLQADATVQYALRATNESPPSGIYWKRDLTTVDLRLTSPYNTYRQPGLPPGPICNPGLASIQAVADAPQTDFLYFVAKSDGSHAFARTLAEHNQNVAQFGAGR